MPSKGRITGIWRCAVIGFGVAAVTGCTATSDEGGQGSKPNGTDSPAHIEATNSRGAGEYLVRISGCNDCHTPGYSQSGGKIPLGQWLTGSSVGCRGPWGTTYASNLRLYIDPMSEDDFVRVMRSRNDKPPMPWQSLHAMSDPDLRAIYRFIKSLGKGGSPAPQDLPPGQEPGTPFIVYAPPTMPGHDTR